MDYLKLIDNLIEQRHIKTPLIIEAFRVVHRSDFLPKNLKGEAGVNAPLPIGFGQTNSQPLTVAFMLELLQPQTGEKILDIGAGSGWTSALLARCVSSSIVIPTPQQRGRNLSRMRDHVRTSLRDSSVALLPQNNKKGGGIYAIERIPELCEFGKNNIAKYNFIEKGVVKIICADGTPGLPAQAPFDKILVSASADRVPEILKKQLKIGGKMVVPVQNSIWSVARKSKEEFNEEEFFGFSFVPLIES